MISRTTWIILAIFVIALALAIYLQNSPVGSPVSLTPSPTAYPKLMEDLSISNVLQIEVDDSKGIVFILNLKDKKWIFKDTPELAVDQGKVQQLFDELLSADIFLTLPADTKLDNIGLTVPSYTIKLNLNDGKIINILIGNKTPVENGGYYVQVDKNTPVVINSGTGDAITGLLTQDSLTIPTETVTPFSTEIGEKTPVPSITP